MSGRKITKSSESLIKFQVSPEIHYKMSKKIAQLTKVIYYLNTKNEDQSDELETLTLNYQNHVSNVRLIS